LISDGVALFVSFLIAGSFFFCVYLDYRNRVVFPKFDDDTKVYIVQKDFFSGGTALDGYVKRFDSKRNRYLVRISYTNSYLLCKESQLLKRYD